MFATTMSANKQSSFVKMEHGEIQDGHMKNAYKSLIKHNKCSNHAQYGLNVDVINVFVFFK